MKKENSNVIEINEEVEIAQEDGSKVILEKGDKIQLQEATFGQMDYQPGRVNIDTTGNISVSISGTRKDGSYVSMIVEDAPELISAFRKLNGNHNVPKIKLSAYY